MKQVTATDALRDLSKFLREVYCWCDVNGNYCTETMSVSRDTIKQVRRCVDAVQDNMRNGTPIYVMDGCDGVYEQLEKGVQDNLQRLRKEAGKHGRA